LWARCEVVEECGKDEAEGMEDRDFCFHPYSFPFVRRALFSAEIPVISAGMPPYETAIEAMRASYREARPTINGLLCANGRIKSTIHSVTFFVVRGVLGMRGVAGDCWDNSVVKPGIRPLGNDLQTAVQRRIRGAAGRAECEHR
jgi:hypothetical protein